MCVHVVLVCLGVGMRWLLPDFWFPGPFQDTHVPPGQAEPRPGKTVFLPLSLADPGGFRMSSLRAGNLGSHPALVPQLWPGRPPSGAWLNLLDDVACPPHVLCASSHGDVAPLGRLRRIALQHWVGTVRGSGAEVELVCPCPWVGVIVGMPEWGQSQGQQRLVGSRT